MGLPCLTLNADLAATWHAVLEKNGMSVHGDEIEGEKVEPETALKRISEVPWRVGAGDSELPILEVTFRDRNDGNVYLICMPLKTRAEGELLSHFTKVLVEAGAAKGKKKESRVAKGNV
jgi:hypothetical protein